jgi:hypothetical protein
MARNTQDEIILSTLLAARYMTGAAVWSRIKVLAENDQSRPVTAAARQLLLERDRLKVGD